MSLRAVAPPAARLSITLLALLAACGPAPEGPPPQRDAGSSDLTDAGFGAGGVGGGGGGDGGSVDASTDAGLIDSGSEPPPWVPPPAPKRELPVCAGDLSVTYCDELATWECTTVLGCSVEGDCTGFAESCYSQYYDYQCLEVDGCYWSTYNDDCTGSSTSCSLMFSEFACTDQPGCNWEEECGGIVTGCAGLGLSTCTTQVGCNVECLSDELFVCDDLCVDVSDDEEHCGGCDVNCGPRGVCTDYQCLCDEPYTVCNDLCVDLRTDANNCSACGNACGAGFACVARACVDVDECAGEPCEDGRVCANTDGGYSCGPCPTGYVEAGANACSDVNECATNNGGCDELTSCSNTPGSHTCGACPDGYTGSGSTSCTDINECATNNGGCDPQKFCFNSGGGFSCSSCATGYMENLAGACVDVNECNSGIDDCDDNPVATCVNTTGDYDCDCPDGFTGDGHGPSGCADVNECTNGTHDCDTTSGASCADLDGGYQCVCPLGYDETLTSPVGCADVNECIVGSDDCDNTPMAQCMNTTGHHDCDCPDGFTGDGHGTGGCVDIDECANGTHNCDSSSGASCMDMDGSFDCRCPNGFDETLTSPVGCVDRDECAANTDGCTATPDACHNYIGFFECACPMGYAGNGRGPSGCTDIDECYAGTDTCDRQPYSCNNTVGGYECNCPAGFDGDGEGSDGCQDVNECLGAHGCASAAACGNIEGGYGCKVGVAQVSAGLTFTCARLLDGRVKCWGDNSAGQLGVGDSNERGSSPGTVGPGLPAVNLGSGRTAVQISAGGFHACALLDNGAVKCWGDNAYGQLGLGDTDYRGDEPGEMGDALPAVNLGPGRTVAEISAGVGHSCVRFTDAAIKCWGYNGLGQLGIGDAENRGDAPNEMGATLPIVNLGTGRTASSVQVGWYRAFALLDNGSLKGWGYNERNTLGIVDSEVGDSPDELGDALVALPLGTGRTVTQFASGARHACAVLDDGRVKCWGDNETAQLGVGYQGGIIGEYPSQWGDNLPAVDLGTGLTAVSVHCGDITSCALFTNGKLKCWGHAHPLLGQGNMEGLGDDPSRLGDGMPFIDLGTGRTISSFSIGGSHACAILDDGTLKCWGGNYYGQLGIGDAVQRGYEPNQMGDNLPAVLLGP